MRSYPLSNLSSVVQIGEKVKEWRLWRRKRWVEAEQPAQAVVISSLWLYATTSLARDWRSGGGGPYFCSKVLRRACMCRLRCSRVLIRLGRFMRRKRLLRFIWLGAVVVLEQCWRGYWTMGSKCGDLTIVLSEKVVSFACSLTALVGSPPSQIW